MLKHDISTTQAVAVALCVCPGLRSLLAPPLPRPGSGVPRPAPPARVWEHTGSYVLSYSADTPSTSDSIPWGSAANSGIIYNSGPAQLYTNTRLEITYERKTAHGG